MSALIGAATAPRRIWTGDIPSASAAKGRDNTRGHDEDRRVLCALPTRLDRKIGQSGNVMSSAFIVGYRRPDRRLGDGTPPFQ